MRPTVSTARSAAVAFTGAAAAAVAGFALTIVVSRGLGRSGAGVFFEAVALFSILAAVATLGADTGLLRSLSRLSAIGRLRDLRPTIAVAMTPVVLLGLVLSAASWLFSPALARVFIDERYRPDALPVLHWVLPVVVLAGISMVALQACRGFGLIAPFVGLQNVALPLLRVLLIGAALLTGSGLLTVTGIWAGVLLPITIAACALLVRALRRSESRILPDTPPARPHRRLAAEFWSFAAVRGLSSIIDLSLVWTDVLLVGALRSAGEAGVYAAASRLITSGTLVLQAFRIAIAPQISTFLATDRPRAAETVYRMATQWIILLSWPLYLIAAVFGSYILRIFGDGFRAGATALTVLAVAMLVTFAVGNVETVLLMGGRSSWLFWNKIVALAANVGLNLVLIPAYGIVGAALAWAVSICVTNIAAAVQVHVLLKIDGYDSGTRRGMIAALLCYGVVGVLGRVALGDGAVALISALLVGTVAYLGLLWWWRSRLQLDLLADLLPGGLGARVSALSHQQPGK